MKRKMLCLVLCLTAASLVYGHLMQPVELPVEGENNAIPMIKTATRNPPPEYRFHIEPMDIATTYYDYFPGSYSSFPLRVQPSPAGNHGGGGVYLTKQITSQLGGIRRAYYSYILDGEITSHAMINLDFPPNLSDGFPSLDLDWETGNPIFSWHAPSQDNPAVIESKIAFDHYSDQGTPGQMSDPFNVNLINDDGIFIWPEVHIGPSPNEGMKRVYVIGKNLVANQHDYPCSNVMVAFSDYEDITDLQEYDPDQWNYVTIPQMDQWRDDNIRPFFATIVSRETGHIALMGHTSLLDEHANTYNDDSVIFLLENTNFGEGEWHLYTTDPTLRVQNPINPETGQRYFIGPGDFAYHDMRFIPYVSRTGATVDEMGNYHFTLLYTLFTEAGTYYPIFSNVKHIKFDRLTRQFSINDLYPKNEDNTRYLPWSDPPQFDPEHGYLIARNTFPCYWWDAPSLFHENYARIVSDGPYMVALFQESSKAKMSHDYNIPEYETWANNPETYIIVSGDYGETWSSPVIMNANQFDIEPDDTGVFHGNYVPQLEGMIPAYWYIADSIETTDEGLLRIHLTFLDQNHYGSSVHGNSPITGGTIKYTSIDIDLELGQRLYPATAENPQPENNSFNVPISLEMLSWDYVVDTLYVNPAGFRVYFNETGQFGEDDDFDWIPYIEEQGEYATSQIMPAELHNNNTYYWKVIPTTKENGTGQGRDALDCPVWTFTAEPIQYPTTAANPVPADDSLNVSVELESLSWNYIVDTLHINPAGFRVYFNETGQFGEDDDFAWVPYIEEQVEYHSTGILPEQLQSLTTYYWKVIPTITVPNLKRYEFRYGHSRTERNQKDRLCRGDAQDCPIWSFETEDVTAVETPEPQLLTALKQNYPNPFNPETVLEFSIAEPGHVIIEIFNNKGQKVKTVVDEFFDMGKHKVVWNGRNEQNVEAGSGLYFYRMKTAKHTQIKRMLLLK